jgi:hypothetical protein
VKLANLKTIIGGGVADRYSVRKDPSTKEFTIHNDWYGRFEEKYGTFETKDAAERFLKEKDAPTAIEIAQHFDDTLQKEIGEKTTALRSGSEEIKVKSPKSDRE